MQIIGHRGARRLALENSLAALAAAFEEGAHGVEFDVRLSADGEPVLWHDDDLLAWGGPAVPVGRLRWRDLRGVVLTDGHGHRGKMAHFDEFLERFGQRAAPINIELKVSGDPPGTGPRLAAAVLRRLGHGTSPGWIVSSFDRATLVAFAVAATGVELAALVAVSSCDLQDLGSQDHERAAAALGQLRSALAAPLGAIHPHFDLVDDARCRRWRSAELALRTWTVNSPQGWRRALDLGLEAVITDDPGGARRWMDEAVALERAHDQLSASPSMPRS